MESENFEKKNRVKSCESDVFWNWLTGPGLAKKLFSYKNRTVCFKKY